MATAKKLPSGNWRVQVKKNGICKSFTSSSAEKAEKMAEKWKNSFNQNEKPKTITVKDAYELYISSKEKVLSASTIKAYRSLQKNTFRELMQMDIEKLDTLIVQKSVSLFSINHSPKCVRNAYSLFSASVGMFLPDKIFNVTLPQKEKKNMYIPDDNDIKILIENSKGTRMEIPILLACFGPMRRGEICALTDKDIIGNVVSVNKSMVMNSNNEWEIKKPKTFSSYRNIEFPDFVIEKLKGKKGNITEMTPSAITDAFPDILQKAGLPKFRFHDLRHYAVSTLHAQNIPDKYIQARGGWQTNYTMNNVYNHTIKNKMDETELKIISHFNSIFDTKTP